MRFLFVFVFVAICDLTVQSQTIDSIEVRIFNRGPHYIKKHVVKIDHKDYVFMDVWKGKYSSYLKLPYLWSINQTMTTVIINRMINYDRWMTSGEIPIDYIGEIEYTTGKFCIKIKTKRKKDRLLVEQEVVKE